MNHQSSHFYYLPPDTAKVIQKYVERCHNLALVLDKYVKRNVIDDPKQKGAWLRTCVQHNTIDGELAHSAYHRWLAMIKSRNATCFDAELEWRMVIGLGGETVLETDLTLHHLYGIPFIPGSALKGLTRAYVTVEEKKYFVPPADKPEAECKPSLEEKTDHLDIQRIFGSQDRAGTVIFFDALPLDGKAKFVVDIMNPHYPNYYNSLQSNNIEAPANNQSPNPIPFLTVTNTTFTVALAPRNPNEIQHQEDVKLVTEWLLRSLQKYGIGGKTSAGYGYFKDGIPPLVTPKSDNQAPSATQVSPAIVQTENWKRPSISHFREKQELQDCRVLAPTEMMLQQFPAAKVFLSYKEFPSNYVFIAIEEETPDMQAWKPKEMRACIFLREERRGDCLVLICRPKIKRK